MERVQADESNSGPRCFSPPLCAVLGHSPLSIQRRTPEVWWPSSGFRLCIFRERYRQSRHRSVRSLRGRERECFPIRFVQESNSGPPRSVLYSAVLASHRLFPFQDYGCCFRVPWCRSHRSRGTCAADALRGDAIRRTSFGRHSPPSTTGLSVAGDLFSLEISSFHRRSCRRRRRPLSKRRRRRRTRSPALVPSPPPVASVLRPADFLELVVRHAVRLL